MLLRPAVDRANPVNHPRFQRRHALALLGLERQRVVLTGIGRVDAAAESGCQGVDPLDLALVESWLKCKAPRGATY